MENELHCPECGHNVTKAGRAWSGRKRYQQYHCSQCGRKTIRPIGNDGLPMEKTQVL